MLFSYKGIDKDGNTKSGEIDAVGRDVALTSLQRRGIVVIKLQSKEEKKGLSKISFFDKVPMKDVVIMSRQIATLFEAQVSPVKGFTLLLESMENETLRRTLEEVVQDVQGGLTISEAMGKHPRVFSDFYVNMVRAGEESGKLSQTFMFLADHLERSYELLSKTRNALIYPVFVVVTFIVVIVLMMTLVIPKLSEILIDTGQQLPIYTRVVIGVSDFFVGYGIILLAVVAALGVFLWRYGATAEGSRRIDATKLEIPYIGNLYQKVYLSRIADNIHTMLASGIPVLKTLEITGSVVDNKVYKEILEDTIESVKAGSTIAAAMNKHEFIPQIMVQMIQVGEETGSTDEILATLSRFYKREVDRTIDTLIDLIEPAMVIGLGVGVGFLLTSILLPIYNIATSF